MIKIIYFDLAYFIDQLKFTKKESSSNMPNFKIDRCFYIIYTIIDVPVNDIK